MKALIATLTMLGLAAGCGDNLEDHCADGHVDEECPADEFPHTLYVAHEGTLVSYDIASGEERPGTVTDVTGPVDMQALDDGTIMVNLTGENEILVVDGTTMLEISRIPSSGMGGVRPVHSYITPERQGRTFWVTMNDGAEETGNSAAFIDITPGSGRRFVREGEVALGVGHHKASFSTTTSRFVASNITDCDNVITVYDYSNIDDIQALATLDGVTAGFDHEDPGEGEFDPLFCDPTFTRGLPPAPHGCATSAMSGNAYCNITSSGDIAVIDLDAEEPTFELLATSGSGGGKTHAGPGGRYMYSLQESPRGGCTIGQLVVIDAMTDTIAAELPLGYTGPDCEDDLADSPQESANPDHLTFAPDGDILFVGVAGGFEDADARVNQHVVVDVSDPTAPVQLASIPMGVSTGHSSDALTGDGSTLFCVDAVDGTITEVDTASREPVRTLEVGASPKVVATYGSLEGPSEQTGPVE